MAAAIQILLQTVPATFMTQQFELFALMGLQAFLLTIDHGATPFTPAVISIFAMLVRGLLQDYERALSLTTLAKELADRDCPPVRSYAGFVHSYYTNHWLEPIRPSLPEMLEDSQKGFDHGDVQFGCFNAAGYVVLLARAGAPLDEVAAAGAETSERIAGRVAAAAFHSLHEMQMARALAGRTVDRYSFADLPGEGAVEERDVASIMDTDLNNEIAYYYSSKMKLHYYYRDFAEAVGFAEQADELRMSFTGQAEEAEFVFFYGLALIALAGPGGDPGLLERAAACLAQIKAWAGVGPRNFAHKVLMIEGELARVSGDADKAVALRDRSSGGSRHRVRPSRRPGARARRAVPARRRSRRGRRAATGGLGPVLRAVGGEGQVRRRHGHPRRASLTDERPPTDDEPLS